MAKAKPKGDIRTLNQVPKEEKEKSSFEKNITEDLKKTGTAMEMFSEEKTLPIKADIKSAMESLCNHITFILRNLDVSGVDKDTNLVYRNLVGAKKHLEIGIGYIGK